MASRWAGVCAPAHAGGQAKETESWTKTAKKEKAKGACQQVAFHE
jgi:hypothetical protein